MASDGNRRRLLRGRTTYANVTATLALVFAMSGGALAARHYLITSTKQISPAVLKKLHGARGAAGAIGAIGPQGPTGEVGPKGPRGLTGTAGADGFSALSVLPSGGTENGDFVLSLPAASASQKLVGAVSFPIPLAAGITSEHVVVTPSVTPVAKQCEGPGKAAHGYLCIYTAVTSDVEGTAQVSDPESAVLSEGSGLYGFRLAWTVKEGGAAEVAGSWSVTG